MTLAVHKDSEAEVLLMVLLHPKASRPGRRIIRTHQRDLCSLGQVPSEDWNRHRHSIVEMQFLEGDSAVGDEAFERLKTRVRIPSSSRRKQAPVTIFVCVER